MFWHLLQVLVEKIEVPDSGVRAQVAAQDSPLGETTIPCHSAVDRAKCNLNSKWFGLPSASYTDSPTMVLWWRHLIRNVMISSLGSLRFVKDALAFLITCFPRSDTHHLPMNGRPMTEEASD
jgi:hypothetical protein